MNLQNIDKPLFWSLIILSIFGLIMMSSMSIASSFTITGENDFYFWRHFRYLLIGLVAFFFGIKTPISWLKKFSTLILIVGLGLLISTFFIGQDYGTFAKLWIKIGTFSFQPVEITKLSLIIFLAALFSSNKIQIDTFERGFIPFATVIGISTVIMMMQSDFGAVLIVILVSLTMFFCAGAKIKHLLNMFLTLGVIATIITLTVPYISKRIQVFLDPSLDPHNTGFQIQQALIAIGSGEVFGRGFQNSIQKFDYLPEVQSDTIFSAIAEEMGFFRTLILIGMYLFIAWRGFLIAEKTIDSFSRNLVIGIIVWVVSQAFINIAVNMALLPTTGITLPLISYGGTSMIITFFALGLVLQVSNNTTQQKIKRRW